MSEWSRRRFLGGSGAAAVSAVMAGLPSRVVNAQPAAGSTQSSAAMQTWLALTREEPLEPALPIIDPHHHLWERPTDRYLLDELTTVPPTTQAAMLRLLTEKNLYPIA